MIPKLLCTFTDRKNLSVTVDYIQTFYPDTSNMFVFSDNDEPYSLMITYNPNITTQDRLPKSTILIHRKKETNTLYTINALNCLIKAVNNGVLDKRYKVDWTRYQDCFLLIDPSQDYLDYKVVELNFEKIIRN